MRDIQDEILKHVSELMAAAEPTREGRREAMDRVYVYLYERAADIRLLLDNVDFGIELLKNALYGMIEADPRGETMDRTSRLMANTFILHGAYAVIHEWLTAEQPMPPDRFSTYIRQIVTIL